MQVFYYIFFKKGRIFFNFHHFINLFLFVRNLNAKISRCEHIIWTKNHRGMVSKLIL